MAHYLDPKNDLVFKRIFGEHPNLLISLLNALLPLEEDRRVESIEYLSPEMVPENPLKKFSIVDVRCKDNRGRYFIVEMQMEWSNAFPNRMLYNATKAYSRQLKRRERYDTLQPVYGLGILNDNFDHKTENFYHHYRMSNRENTDEVIEGIELIFIELKKFKPEKMLGQKMTALWLHFLNEMHDGRTDIPDDLKENAEILTAVEMCEEGGFTENELAIYDRHWDYVLKETMFLHASFTEGLAKGEARGAEEREKLQQELSQKDQALSEKEKENEELKKQLEALKNRTIR